METYFKAISKNDLTQVRILVEQDGMNINQVNEFGYSALHVALSKGYVELSKYLIIKGVDVNLVDKNGQTALHYVGAFGLFILIDQILLANGKLDIEDIFGNEPLWTAVYNDKGRNDRFQIVKSFLENGANPDHINKAGKSPKDFAWNAGYNNLMTLFEYQKRL